MACSFFDKDEPHSLGKRIILRNVLGGIFPCLWNSRRASRYPTDASVNYLDGFGGKGAYRKLNDNNEDVADYTHTPGDDVSRFGSPVIAVDRALEALSRFADERDMRTYDEVFGRYEFVVNFVFNEKLGKNLASLKDQVGRRFQCHGWRQEGEEGASEGDESCAVFVGTLTLRTEVENYVKRTIETKMKRKTVKMMVRWFNRSFDRLPLDDIPSPLFSFVDPYGIEQIPMNSMRSLIGQDREVFVNLMVATLNRCFMRERVKPKRDEPYFAINKIYGPHRDEHWWDLASGLEYPDRLQYFAESYFDAIDMEFRAKPEACGWVDGYYSCKFVFRKGVSDPDVGTIYYMGFASCKLSFIHISKQAMMNVTDLPDDLSFSNFYRRRGIDIPYRRKTDNNYEAAKIWEKFNGKTMKLGEIKRDILLETPFVYHARALKVLEDARRIIHVDSGLRRRRRGDFRSLIPKTISQEDDERRVFGNGWRVWFCDEELARALPLPPPLPLMPQPPPEVENPDAPGAVEAENPDDGVAVEDENLALQQWLLRKIAIMISLRIERVSFTMRRQEIQKKTAGVRVKKINDSLKELAEKQYVGLEFDNAKSRFNDNTRVTLFNPSVIENNQMIVYDFHHHPIITIDIS